MEPTATVLRVGLAVGQGTGSELADVFVKVVKFLASRYQFQVEFHRSPRIYHSYRSLFSAGDDHEFICRETAQDAAHYEQFCRDQAAQGTGVIFRTAITAQSLYLVRQNLEAIKIEVFSKPGAEILLVRDQAQGFYTGINEYTADRGSVSRTCQFSKDVTGRILHYSLDRARKAWGEDAVIDSVTMVYKHHLFDGVMDIWAKDWSQAHGLRIQFLQPDTMNRNLLQFGIQGRQLIVTGNEYADIMEVLFLKWFGQGVQETSYSENVYLSLMTDGLGEYQTVHGSADDLTNKGIVNPTATIKAAAAILERKGNCMGVEKAIDRAIKSLLQWKIMPPDQGGKASTAAYVDAVLSTFLSTSDLPKSHSQPLPPSPKTPTIPNRARADMGMKTAIFIIDFQNDFSANPTTGDSPSIPQLASNINKLRHFARAQHFEVIFVRFLGDPDLLPKNWQNRNDVLNRSTQCLSGTQGAEFIQPVLPAPGERVFDKKALFDAFLCEAFEQYLRERGFEHLVLVGLFGDVCVDATARGAFQRGFYVTVVEDCVGMWLLEKEVWVEFARRLYGARVATTAEFVGMERLVARAKLS